MNMAIGAAHAERAGRCCSTSGSGFALMSEGLGRFGRRGDSRGSNRLPKGWPMAGVSTKTEQGDLWQMLGAAFGDYPRALVTSRSTLEIASKSSPKFSISPTTLR